MVHTNNIKLEWKQINRPCWKPESVSSPTTWTPTFLDITKKNSNIICGRRCKVGLWYVCFFFFFQIEPTHHFVILGSNYWKLKRTKLSFTFHALSPAVEASYMRVNDRRRCKQKKIKEKKEKFCDYVTSIFQHHKYWEGPYRVYVRWRC